jgi:radical SAM protein with 4Fe4S-binding SPASM domain
LWRQGKEKYYTGCSAGHTGMGIEADGKIKGCPSLPTTEYTGGNVKDMQLEDIWKYSEVMFFSRHRNKEELWGGCKGCYYESSCLAGCTWTSHVLFGKRGNNPYCHHRALELQKKGLKERIRKIQEAPGNSFDTGLFEIVVENEQGEIIEVQKPGTPVELKQDSERKMPRMPTPMILCHGCDHFIYAQETTCPFCQANVQAVNDEYEKNMQAAVKALEKLESLMMQ